MHSSLLQLICLDIEVNLNAIYKVVEFKNALREERSTCADPLSKNSTTNKHSIYY